MKKTKEVVNEFDELLAEVSPELVANYERINLLAGTTLAKTNQLYKGENKEFSLTMIKGMSLILLFGANGITWTLMAMLIFLVPFPICLAPIGVIMVPLLMMGRLWKMTDEVKLKFAGYAKTLSDFRDATDNLSPYGDFLGAFSGVNIRKVFASYAQGILRTEAEFDIVRRFSKREEEQISDLLEQLKSRRGRLSVAIAKAKKFGLEFTPTELYAEAKK